jgi:hypothetical protein
MAPVIGLASWSSVLNFIKSLLHTKAQSPGIDPITCASINKGNPSVSLVYHGVKMDYDIIRAAFDDFISKRPNLTLKVSGRYAVRIGDAHVTK